MKYIRTKDGVYEIESYYEPRDYYWVKQDCDQPIGSDEIIKQADNIEELCDEFIVVENDYQVAPYGINTKDLNLKLFVKNNYDYCKIFGAIWTDRGLIYVAKMNDKGELELL